MNIKTRLSLIGCAILGRYRYAGSRIVPEYVYKQWLEMRKENIQEQYDFALQSLVNSISKDIFEITQKAHKEDENKEQEK